MRKPLVANVAATAARLLCCVALSACWLAAQQKQPADLILRNGKILTVDKNFSIAQAIAVTGHKITAVGTDAEVMKLAGKDTQVVDVKGRTIVPGIMDTHLHYTGMEYGTKLSEPEKAIYVVDWRGVRTKEDVLNQIAGIIKKYNIPPGQWIHFDNQLQGFSGEGSDVTNNQRSILFDQLNRWELDKASPNNPIVMSEGIPEYNGLLINGVAMDILMKQFGDFVKKNGRYWIDATGRPDGHLESVATRPIMMKWEPQPTPETLAPLFRMTQEDLASIGQTVDSGRYPVYRVAALRLLESRGQLMERTAYGFEDAFGVIEDMSDLKKMQGIVGSGTDKLWITSIAPSSVDGTGSRACTNMSRTGSLAIDNLYPMGQCYQDSEYNGAAAHAAPIGSNYYHDWIMASAKYGIRFANTHMSGDRSVNQWLKMVAEAQAQFGPDSTKYWGSDHCNSVNPADLPQAAKLHIYFSCQANIGGEAFAKEYGDKAANSFPSPVKSMLNLGINVSLEGEGGRAWVGIERLITRKDNNGKVWAPQERLTRQEALTMATRNAANYVLKPDKLGSLEVGKLADIVVLDQDYMTMPEEQIHTMQPQLTVLDGDIIFVHTAFANEANLHPAGAVISTNKELTGRRGGRGGGGAPAAAGGGG